MSQINTSLRVASLSLAILAAIATGWFLNAAQAILVPLVLGALLAFLMDGMSRVMGRIPLYSQYVPDWLRMMLTTVVLFIVLAALISFFARNLDPVVRAMPGYLERLSQTSSDVAARFDVEFELTWQSLDRLLFDNIDVQRLIRVTVNSVSYSAGYLALVFLYAILFLIERGSIPKKVAAIVPDDKAQSNVWQTIDLITAQIGTYFTTKTLIQRGAWRPVLDHLFDLWA